MVPAFPKLLLVSATLWLGCGVAHAAGPTVPKRPLVDLTAADFVNGSKHWPQHTTDTGIPGHFIAHGSPTQQTVAGAPAVVFDGDGDYFQGPATTAALHAPGAPYTVAVWAFQGNLRDQESMISWSRRGGPDASFAGFRYGSDPDFGAVAVWATSETGYRTPPPPGRWHHLVFTYDGSNLAVYVDGRLDHEKIVGTLDAHNALPILLGAELGGDLQLAGKFTHYSGALGRVRIDAEALDGATILRRFRAESPGFPGLSVRPLARPPLHRFSCNTTAGPAPDGTVIRDSIGGLVAVVRGANARFTGIGLRLPGGSSATEAYLDLPNRLISTQEDVTIELWETQEAALDWCRILSIGTNQSGEIPGPGGSFSGSETLTLFGNVGSAPINRFARSAGTLLNGGPDHDPADYPESDLGTRFHQVIVYQKALAEWRWYRDGVLMEVIPDAEGPITLDDVNVWLGRAEFSADNNFRGVYHEVRVYNRALEEGEIFGNCRAGPASLNHKSAMLFGRWTGPQSGRHPFANTASTNFWNTGPGKPPPNGIGATATLASALAGDVTLDLNTAVTLGALNLGAANGGGTFTLEALGGGSLTLDSGAAGPASLAQLPRSLENVLNIPITLASPVEIANFSDNPLVLSGPISGQGRLTKTGPGPVVLTHEGSRFQGELRVLTGRLILANPPDSDPAATNHFTVAEAGSLVMNPQTDIAITPLVAGDGRFYHEGSGQLTLTRAATLANTGDIIAADGAGLLISDGTIDGASALRIDTAMELGGHSRTRVREHLGVGVNNGGELTIRDGAEVVLAGGEGALNVGDAGSGQGVLNMQGGTLVCEELSIGKNTGTSGILRQSGGKLTKHAGSADARIGGALEGTHDTWGAYILTGGTFTSEANFQVGASGFGLFEIDGGSAIISDFMAIGRFQDAFGGKSRGLIDVKAGRLAVSHPQRRLLVGEEGVGILNIRGHGEVFCANHLVIGAGTLSKPGDGTVNLLQGGSLTTNGIEPFNPTRATSCLLLDGGVLKAGASNAAFLEGLDQTFVGPGGAWIDTNGFDITVAQPLCSPVGSGVASVPVIRGGASYPAPPLIQIAGEDGCTATAVAVVADGVIHEIVITNPGSGYTSAPTVSVLGGGGGSGLTLGTPTLKPNLGGGLTKRGEGRLTLAGHCTYPGPTTVAQGELRISGKLGAAAVTTTVARGATLSGSGSVCGKLIVEPGASVTTGPPPGVLTIDGDLQLSGLLTTTINDTQASHLAVTGRLELARAKLAVVTNQPPAGIAHIIASYGSLNGRFATAELAPGFSIDYNFHGLKQIALVPAIQANGR